MATATITADVDEQFGARPYRMFGADQNDSAEQVEEARTENDVFLPEPTRRSRAESRTSSSTFADAVEPADGVGGSFNEPRRSVDATPFIRLSDRQLKPRRFKVIQQWEGIVEEVAETSIWVRISDLTDRRRPDEFVELPKAEICDADFPLVVPGGVFYWIIGYNRLPTGTIERTSVIRFRRNPRWTSSKLQQVKREAANVYAELISNGAGHIPAK